MARGRIVTAAQLLNDLRLAGVELTAAGGKLHCRAPSGALSDNLRAAMQARKAERLALSQVGTGESPSTVPPARAAEPGRATSGENRAVMPKVGTDQSTPTVPTSGCCWRNGRSCPIPAYWPAKGGGVGYPPINSAAAPFRRQGMPAPGWNRQAIGVGTRPPSPPRTTCGVRDAGTRQRATAKEHSPWSIVCVLQRLPLHQGRHQPQVTIEQDDVGVHAGSQEPLLLETQEPRRVPRAKL